MFVVLEMKRVYNINMRTYYTVIILVGFISISIFGLLTIHHQGGHITECLATQLNGSAIPCPEADPLGFANFHNTALKKISNLLLIDSSAASYMMVISLYTLFGFLLFRIVQQRLINPVALYALELQAITYQLPTKLAWLSLHEKRDPASVI